MSSLPSVIKTRKPSNSDGESRSSVSFTATFDGDHSIQFTPQAKPSREMARNDNTENNVIDEKKVCSRTANLVDLGEIKEEDPAVDWTDEYKVPGDAFASESLNSNVRNAILEAKKFASDNDSRSTLTFQLPPALASESSNTRSRNDGNKVKKEKDATFVKTTTEKQSAKKQDCLIPPQLKTSSKSTLKRIPCTQSHIQRESSVSSSTESLPEKVKRAISQARRQITSDNDSRSTLTFQIPTDVDASQDETSLSVNKQSATAFSEKKGGKNQKAHTKEVKFHISPAEDSPLKSHSPLPWSPTQQTISGILKHPIIQNQTKSSFEESDASGKQSKSSPGETDENSASNDHDSIASRESELLLITEIPMNATSNDLADQSSHDNDAKLRLVSETQTQKQPATRKGEKRTKAMATSSSVLERARKVLQKQNPSTKTRPRHRRQRQPPLRAESRDEQSDSIDSRTKIAVLDKRIQHIVRKARIMSRHDGHPARQVPARNSQQIHRTNMSGCPHRHIPAEMTIAFDPEIVRSNSTLTYPQEILETANESSASSATNDTPYPASLFPQRPVERRIGLPEHVSRSSSSGESSPSLLPAETTQKILQQAFEATHKDEPRSFNLPETVVDAFEGHDCFDEEESIRTSDAGDSGFQVVNY